MLTPTPSQNEVIQCAYEPATTVKVIAGPGSGKTLTLMLKVRELILKGVVRADEVLVLSLTNKAVDNVISQLKNVFSEVDATPDGSCEGTVADLVSQIGVYTIHGLANRVVVENEGLINIIEENGWRGLSKLIPANLLKKYVSGRRSTTLTPKMFERLFREYQAKKKVNEKDAVMEQIITIMKASKVFTNEELILLATKHLRSGAAIDTGELPSMTSDLLHKYKVVIVDEYQDLFPSLGPFLSVISQKQQLFLFGDPHQSIYGFLGDNRSVIRSLESMRPPENLKVFHLYDNFRSTPEITKWANAVAGDISRAITNTKAFFSKEPMGIAPSLIEIADPLEELEFIMDKICQLVSNSVKLSDIAVLTRTNAQLKAVSDHFSSYGIPTEKLTAQPDWMTDKNIKFLVDLLKACMLINREKRSAEGVRQHQSDFSVIVTLSSLRGVSNQSIQALFGEAQKANVSLWNFISQSHQWPVGVSNRTKIQSFVEHVKPLLEILEFDESLTPISIISRLVTVSHQVGFKPDDMKNESDLDIFREHLIEMLSVLKLCSVNRPQNISLTEWFLETWMDQHSSFIQQVTNERNDINDLGAVKISTIHSSKGLEFPVVFLSGSSNANFPMEKNALYVGMTRARNFLYMTNVKNKLLPPRNAEGNTGIFGNQAIWTYYNKDLNRAIHKRAESGLQKYRTINQKFSLNPSVRVYSTMARMICNSCKRI
ncbi:LAQU0S03e08086g1_1 [Lachancea quebecensis]|uniref:DNA 3'-5' helicase n=1 Tax=Lachancea quebecensis TaxID=1654605 RepID=A0A0P1KNQ9_9SACH|nr:LAQU0S03e08086g1_1 [Lachancea quebecensis]